MILRLSQQNDMVLVEVIDQGQGIPDQFKPRIFEKFSQADASDSRSKEGTGLGLTICKRIIESHGVKLVLVAPNMLVRSSGSGWPG